MPQVVNVGLIGCGSMGSELARAVKRGDAGRARIVGLFDEYEPGRHALAEELDAGEGSGPAEFDSVSDLIALPDLDLVVECASQVAVVAHAEAILSAGVSMLVMSSGALTSSDFMQSISEISAKTGASIYVPSGAVGGIDTLRAARSLLESVTIVSTSSTTS